MTFTAHVRVVRLVAVIVRPTSRYAVMKAMGLITVLLMVSHAVEETAFGYMPTDCTFDPGVCDDAAGEQCVEAASFCMQSCGEIPECAATGYECQDGMCIPGPDATGEPPMCDPAEAGQCGDGSECVTQSICVIG